MEGRRLSDPLDGTDEAATPLTEEEREELIPTYITLRSELNEAEQANILAAQKWAFTRKRDILDERFLTQLHKHMFGQVWRWAGNFRRTARSTSMHYAPLIDMTSRLYCFL